MTQDTPDFGTPDIEKQMLRSMIDQLTQQVSDLSRYLIATVDASGGNIELATHVLASLDTYDSIDISIDPTEKWVRLKVIRIEG